MGATHAASAKAAAGLFRTKTGLPWRDLPERFGTWKSVYNRFANWAAKDHWAAIFRELQLEVDETGSMVDGSVVRADHFLALIQIACAWLWLI